MFVPEFESFNKPNSDTFRSHVETSAQSEYLGDLFRTKLLIGFDKAINLGEKDFPLMCFIPSIDFPSDFIQKIGSAPKDSLIIVAQSRMPKLTSGIDLIALGYLDEERLGYGLKKVRSEKIISGENRQLNLVKTVVPIIEQGERFDLTKEEFSVSDSRKGEETPLNTGYTLSVANYRVRIPQKTK